MGRGHADIRTCTFHLSSGFSILFAILSLFPFLNCCKNTLLYIRQLVAFCRVYMASLQFKLPVLHIKPELSEILQIISSQTLEQKHIGKSVFAAYSTYCIYGWTK